MKKRWLPLFSKFISLFYIISIITFIFLILAIFYLLFDFQLSSFYLQHYYDITISDLLLKAVPILFKELNILYMLTYARNMIDNIINKHYFVTTNLINIKKIFNGFINFFMIDLLRQGILFILKEQSLLDSLATFFNQSLITVFYLGFTFIIYLVFDFGIAVQEDSKQII